MNIASAGGKYKSPFAFSTQNYGGYEGVLNNHVQHVHKVHNASSTIDNAPPTAFKNTRNNKKKPIKRRITKKRKEKLYRRIGHPDVSTLVTKKFRLPQGYPTRLPGSPQEKTKHSQIKMISPKTNAKSKKSKKAYPFVEHISGQIKNNEKLNLPEFIDYDEVELSSIKNFQTMEKNTEEKEKDEEKNGDEFDTSGGGFSPFYIPDDLEITFGEQLEKKSRVPSAMSQRKQPNETRISRTRPASKASTRRTNSRASSAIRRMKGQRSSSRPASRATGRRNVSKNNQTSFVFLNKQEDPNSPTHNQERKETPTKGKQFWSTMDKTPEEVSATVIREKLTNILYDEDDLRLSSSPQKEKSPKEYRKSPSKSDKKKKRRIYETKNGITKPIRKHEKFKNVQSRYKETSRSNTQIIKKTSHSPNWHATSPKRSPASPKYSSPIRRAKPTTSNRRNRRANSPSSPYSPPTYDHEKVVDHGISPFADPYSYLTSNYYEREASPSPKRKKRKPQPFYDEQDESAFDFLKPNDPIVVDDQDDDNASVSSRPTSRSSNRPYSSRRPSSRSSRPGSSRYRPGSRGGTRHRRRHRANARDPFFNDDMDDLMVLSEISKLDHVQEDAPRYMFPQMVDQIDPKTFTKEPVIAPSKISTKKRDSLQLAPLFV